MSFAYVKNAFAFFCTRNCKAISLYYERTTLVRYLLSVSIVTVIAQYVHKIFLFKAKAFSFHSRILLPFQAIPLLFPVLPLQLSRIEKCFSFFFHNQMTV